MMHFLKKYSFLLGLALLVLIVLRLDFAKLAQVLKTVNYSYLTQALLLTLPLWFLKGLCWNYLKKIQGIKYHIIDSFLISNIGAAMGTLTPGRAGELIKLVYLKKDGHSMGKSLLTIALDRLSDFLVLAIFAYIGLLAFFHLFYKITFYFGLAIIILVAIVFLVKRKLVQKLFRKAFFLLVPRKHQKSFRLNFNDFVKGFFTYKPSNWLVVFLITASSWLIYYYQTFLLAKSLGIEKISFLNLATIVTITGFAALLPISILGLGTREGMLILFFSLFSISKEIAVSFSFLVLSLSLTADIIGLLSFMIKPIGRENLKTK